VSPAVKYTLGRIGLFLLCALALWPVALNVLLKLMLAVLFSAALAFFLLRGWRDEMAAQLAGAAERRKAQRERLRAALAGEDKATPPAQPAAPGEPRPSGGEPGSGDAPGPNGPQQA
jgi:hypothetical protein